MDLKELMDSLDPEELEASIQKELNADLNPFPGLHGKTYADLGCDFKLGTLTLQNSLSRMVWLHSIDSPFVQPREKDQEITGTEAAECAFILANGPARLDSLIRWQMAQRLYPDNENLALIHRAEFSREACEWFEGILENHDDFQDLTNSLVQIILASMRATGGGSSGDDVNLKKKE